MGYVKGEGWGGEGGLCKGGGMGGGWVGYVKEEGWGGGLYKLTPFWLTGMSVGNDL